MLAVFVALAMVGRFLMVLVIAPWFAARKATKSARADVAPAPQGLLRRNLHIVAFGALILFPPLMVMLFAPGLAEVRSYFLIQILDLRHAGLGPEHRRGGLAGLLDLGYAAFMPWAPIYALLSTYFGLSFWLLLPLAGILAAFWGVILGFPVLRLRGDYLAIVTLAFGEIIRLALINWV